MNFAVLGRPLQIGMAQDALRRQAVLLGVVQKLAAHGGELLIRTVVIDADGPHRRCGLHIFSLTARGNGHAAGHLGRAVDRKLDEVYPPGDIRTVGPHGLQSCVAEQNGLVRHVIAAVGAAVYELLRQLQILDLSGGYLGPLVQLFDVEIQLVRISSIRRMSGIRSVESL